MRYKKRFSKTAKKEFAMKMAEIEKFCKENNIHSSLSNDSYYFTLNDKFYRVSNHTISASNRHAFDEFGQQKRELYHDADEENFYICITASKTRIIEIYNNLKQGKILNKRGYVI